MSNQVFFSVGGERLAAVILGNPEIKPRFVYVHGGGVTSLKERVLDIAPVIIDRGLSLVSFDFSGHGQSTGKLTASSLKKRVEQARAAIDTFADNGELILCAASMGGHVALKLLDYYRVETLILFWPALYAASAYDVRFDQGFTDIIRQPESWRTTDVLPLLKRFKGNFLIVMGDQDEVIPPGVIDLIWQNATNVRKKELYTIPGCPHKIHTWLSDKPQKLKELQGKIAEFLA